MRRSLHISLLSILVVIAVACVRTSLKAEEAAPGATVTTNRTVTINGAKITYSATAGMSPVKDTNGKGRLS